MRRIRIVAGTVALLALAASAVADAPKRSAVAEAEVVCSVTGQACPLPCGPCTGCPLPCAGEAAGQACATMASASH